MLQGQSPAEATGIREVTARALILGVLLAVAMAVANVYLGLLVGMTVSASIPAAVISMGVLRGLLGGGTILENNLVQTIASAGESLAAGIIFTMPALVLTGIWQEEFDFWVTTAVALTGGLFGVLFMIPLRRPMIVDNKELTYPEGVACERVLTAGERGGSGMRLVFGALGVSALFKILVEAFGVLRGNFYGALPLGRGSVFLGYFTGPALLGVGFIVGLNIAFLVFTGGALSYLLVGPLLTLVDYDGLAGVADPASAIKPYVRMLGVGAMVVGGLWSILMIRHGIREGLRQTLGGYRASMGSGSRPDRTDRDMDSRWILFLVLATTLIVLFLYYEVTGGALELSIVATVLMGICSFFFVAVAAYIVGLVGSSNSPVSGMTICSVLLTSAIVFLFGFRGDLAILATLGVAGVVCCATCTSGDVCQDLKTGSLVGATPQRQQWAEVLGVVAAAFVMQPTLQLLHGGYGIGTDAHLPEHLKGNVLEAPQAQLFTNLMNGFFGNEEIAWDLVAAGALIGLLLILVDQLVLAPRRSALRLHVMPVAVGMYLPIYLSVPILAGGLVAWAAGRKASNPEARRAGHGRGVLVASGLIAGEGIAGVLIASPRAAQWEPWDWLGGSPWSTLLTIAAIGALVAWLIRVSRPRVQGAA